MLEQLDIFNFIDEKQNTYKIKNKIRLIELFAGIGSQAKALKRIGADFEHYKVVEFDKYAIASYNAIHNTNFTTQDITQIKGNELEITDTDKYTYIMTYSFPCQDLSLAGKQKGMSKGSSTRSGLLWEVERLLNETKELPQILLMENVPQVHSKKNIIDFDKWIEFLQSKGYSNFWQDLNAKDYGIPQSRNRTFMVSILGGYDYIFPKPFELKLRLKDMLEKEVDEKYYLSDKMINYIVANNEKWSGNNNQSLMNKSIASTINTGEGSRRCDASNYICDDLPENCDLKLYIKEATKKGYVEANDGDGVYINRPHQKRGVVQKGMIQTIKTSLDVGVVVLGNYSQSNHNASRIVDNNGIAPTVMENHGTVTATIDKLRIRKLTPKECWRLMGFDDEDFEKASKVNSNAQLYKQAGNSIVVNVLEAIFKELL